MPNTTITSGAGGPAFFRHWITLQAIAPEKYQPAWGRMPPTGFGLLGGEMRLFSMKPLISASHSEALAGYQLPANTARLRVDGMGHLLRGLERPGGWDGS